MKTDSVYIARILDCIRKAELYVHGYSKEEFIKDSKTQSAVILQLLLIGEVSKQISVETKAKVDLPWRQITGFRDKAIHEYFDIEIDVVWSTIFEDLPLIKEKLS